MEHFEAPHHHSFLKVSPGLAIRELSSWSSALYSVQNGDDLVGLISFELPPGAVVIRSIHSRIISQYVPSIRCCDRSSLKMRCHTRSASAAFKNWS